MSFACSMAASVMSVITTTMLVTLPCSSRMGLRFTENCPSRAVAAHNLQFEIVHLASGQSRVCRASLKVCATTRRHQIHQRTSQQFLLLVTRCRTSAGWRS